MSLMNSSVPTRMELDSYKIAAEAAASNPHWRKLGGSGSSEQIIGTILSVMLLAREIGMPPMSSIAWGINNIQGKFEISARGMNQLIRKRGHTLKLKSLTNEVCVIWGKRRDTGEEMEASFTIEEAARAGLIRDGGAWRKTPSDMLFARALSRIGRRLFADCIGGFYIEGELQEAILKQPMESIDAAVIEEFKQDEKMPEIVLTLPDDVDAEHVHKFLQESSTKSNVSIELLKKRASENLGKFLSVYKVWAERQIEPTQ